MLDAKLSDPEVLSRSETDVDLKDSLAAQGTLKMYLSSAISFFKKHKFYSFVASSIIALSTFIIILVVALYETESSRQAKADLIDQIFSNQVMYNCYPSNKQHLQEVHDEHMNETVGKFIVRTLNQYGYTTYPETEVNVYREFDAFMVKYRKVYYTSEEKGAKYMNFRHHYETIKAHNENPESSYKMAWGQYSDLSSEQINDLLLKPISFNEEEINASAPSLFHLFKADKRTTIPDQFTWEPKVLGPVLNQGTCGSCWAFATAGAVQSLFNINNKSNVVLSPQELVDCETKSNGCEGGNPIYAFDYAIGNGLCNLADYPYIAFQKTCSASSCKRKITTHGALMVTGDLDIALTQGSPIVVGINAGIPFQHYSSGIFEAPCNSDVINHTVLLVGYGTDKETGKKYWIIKNSWGSQWGENGYAKIARSDDGQGADCNFANFGLMPL